MTKLVESGSSSFAAGVGMVTRDIGLHFPAWTRERLSRHCKRALAWSGENLVSRSDK